MGSGKTSENVTLEAEVEVVQNNISDGRMTSGIQDEFTVLKGQRKTSVKT